MILVLSAPKRSGKDEVANILKKHHGYQKVGLADPLKKMCAEVFDLSEAYFFDDNIKDKDFETPISVKISNLDKLAQLTKASEIERALLFQNGLGLIFNSPREMLQVVGTELVRTCVNDYFWIKLAISQIKAMEGNIVITDARYENERAALKAIGGTLIRIKRRGYEGTGHASETSIGEDNEYDVIINNDGTLSQLQHDILAWHGLRFKRA